MSSGKQFLMSAMARMHIIFKKLSVFYHSIIFYYYYILFFMSIKNYVEYYFLYTIIMESSTNNKFHFKMKNCHFNTDLSLNKLPNWIKWMPFDSPLNGLRHSFSLRQGWSERSVSNWWKHRESEPFCGVLNVPRVKLQVSGKPDQIGPKRLRFHEK